MEQNHREKNLTLEKAKTKTAIEKLFNNFYLDLINNLQKTMVEI